MTIASLCEQSSVRSTKDRKTRSAKLRAPHRCPTIHQGKRIWSSLSDRFIVFAFGHSVRCVWQRNSYAGQIVHVGFNARRVVRLNFKPSAVEQNVFVAVVICFPDQAIVNRPRFSKLIRALVAHADFVVLQTFNC